MFEILTLFLGLAIGPHPVELKVEEGVQAVELYLDGQAVGTLEGPPWHTEIDLGHELRPHSLTAIARNTQGSEIDRQEIWINLAPPAGPRDGREGTGKDPARPLTPVAVLFESEIPQATHATEAMAGWFQKDGEPLVVHTLEEGPAEVVVVQDPALEPRLRTLAQSSVIYDLILGFGPGDYEFEGRTLGPETLQGGLENFLAQGDEVLAVVIKDYFRGQKRGLATQKEDGELHGRPEDWLLTKVWRKFHQRLDWRDEVMVRYISPMAAPLSQLDVDTLIFSRVRFEYEENVGLLWQIENERPQAGFSLRRADAAAVAGLEAHAAGRRRAVLLLLGEDPEGAGEFSPHAVRAYLEMLQVPFFVWRLGEQVLTDPQRPDLAVPKEALDPTWGAATPINPDLKIVDGVVQFFPEPELDPLRFLDAAFADLRAALKKQRIVWLEGRHAPGSIELSPSARGVRLAGTQPEEGS